MPCECVKKINAEIEPYNAILKTSIHIPEPPGLTYLEPEPVVMRLNTRAIKSGERLPRVPFIFCPWCGQPYQAAEGTKS